jgi:hypothetical protein
VKARTYGIRHRCKKLTTADSRPADWWRSTRMAAPWVMSQHGSGTHRATHQRCDTGCCTEATTYPGLSRPKSFLSYIDFERHFLPAPVRRSPPTIHTTPHEPKGVRLKSHGYSSRRTRDAADHSGPRTYQARSRDGARRSTPLLDCLRHRARVCGDCVACERNAG